MPKLSMGAPFLTIDTSKLESAFGATVTHKTLPQPKLRPPKNHCRHGALGLFFHRLKGATHNP